jgi:hypothetical protein
MFETFSDSAAYRGQNPILFCCWFDARDFYQSLRFLLGTSSSSRSKSSVNFFFFYGATARGGPWPPSQYAPKPLDHLIYLSIRLFPIFLRSVDTSSSHLSTSELILSLCLRLLTCGSTAFSAIPILSGCGAEVQVVGRLNYEPL